MERPLRGGRAGVTNIGIDDFKASTDDPNYYWWQATSSSSYTVDLVLNPIFQGQTYIAYVPLGIEYGFDDTFEINANVAYAVSGIGNDTFTFPGVLPDSDDPFLEYTITVVAGPGDDIIEKVPSRNIGNASAITLNAYGGGGNDLVNGGRQSDYLAGDSYDTITFSNTVLADNALAMPDSGSGDDRLFGYRGSDTIEGGPGNDVIDAGPRGYGDTDIATGGTGADNFLLSYNTDGSGGGTDFWSVWGQNLTDDEVGQAVSSVVAGILGEGASVAAGFALGGLGQLLGSAIESLIDFLLGLDASETPAGGPDVLIVTDFDPSEDVIFVPVSTDVTLNNTVEFFENVAGQSGWGIIFADDDSNVYAQVMLSEAFLSALGIEQSDTTTAQSLLDSVLARSSIVNSDGGLEQLTSKNVLQNLPGGGYTAPSTTPLVPSGTKLAVWGALGPVVADGSVAGFGDQGSITFGSAYSDALTSNPKLVDPNAFTLADSADAATLINGFDGNDLIYGTTYSDTLVGGRGSDVIYTFIADIEDGELVPETVDAGEFDDLVYTGASGGTFKGGIGNDALIFFYGDQIDASKTPAKAYQVVIDRTLSTPLIIDAVPTGSTDTAPKTQPFTSAINTYAVDGFEIFIGGPLNDWIRGAKNDTIGGGAGPDYLDVGAGSMGLTYQTSTAGVTAILQEGILTLKGGDARGDVLDNLFTGSTYNVTNLVGSPEADQLYMIAGDTTLTGGGGDDTFGLFWNPLQNISSIEIDDFDNDVIDLRGIGVTSFDDLDILAPFAFTYTNGSSGQRLQVLVQDNQTPLTPSDFIFAAAVDGRAVGSRASDGFAGGEGRDILDGRGGFDALHGNGRGDLLLGRAGNDLLDGGRGCDTLFGGRGGDRIEAGAGCDLAVGNRGADSMRLGGQADIGRGGGGNDSIYGGGGNDRIGGQGGGDLLVGNAGDDRIGGGVGHDSLFGNRGMDALFGGGGDDELDGGRDADEMSGGAGADLFRLAFGGIDGDVIIDFDASEGDAIVLSSHRALVVGEDAPGVFSVTDGRTVETFHAAGASLDDISILAG